MFVKNLVIDENQLKTYYLPELLPFELHPPVLLFVCVDDYDLASNDVIYDHR